MKLLVTSFHLFSTCILSSKAVGGASELSTGPLDTAPGKLVCVVEARLYR